jgi:Flp pilus assembly protein TadG
MKSNRGQALVEFAIILPVFLMLVFGMIDFGRIILRSNQIENHVQNAVQQSIFGVSDADVENNIDDSVDFNYTFTIELDTPDLGQVTMTMTSEVDIITPGLNLIVDDPYIVVSKRVFSR